MYALMCFSGANTAAAGESSDASTTSPSGGALEFDLAFLAILGVNLLVHLSLLMKSSIVDLKKKIKAKCTCCRKKTAKKVPKTSGKRKNIPRYTVQELHIALDDNSNVSQFDVVKGKRGAQDDSSQTPYQLDLSSILEDLDEDEKDDTKKPCIVIDPEQICKKRAANSNIMMYAATGHALANDARPVNYGPSPQPAEDDGLDLEARPVR